MALFPVFLYAFVVFVRGLRRLLHLVLTFRFSLDHDEMLGVTV